MPNQGMKYQLKTKKWPWPCVCRGGAKKGQPTIRTVRPHVIKDMKVKFSAGGSSFIVSKVHCGKCTRCGELWFSVRSDADVRAAMKAQIDTSKAV